ncbi:MAG: hypothetical protein ACFCGT_12060 [Sandaracinaceae bacterium]
MLESLFDLAERIDACDEALKELARQDVVVRRLCTTVEHRDAVLSEEERDQLVCVASRRTRGQRLVLVC